MKFNSLVPELSVSDIRRSLDFYTKILGFKIEYQREESKFAFLSFDKAQIMIEEANGNWETGKTEYPFGRGINFQIEVKDTKSILASLAKNKYPLKVKLTPNWYRQDNVLVGVEEFLVMDPDGYLLRFSKEIGTRSAN
jgi:catechol 2,3-dioxygenase-like lactoylglutathione lyase family enzyme